MGEPLFRLQIVDAAGVVVRLPAGGQLERDLVDVLTQACLHAGLGQVVAKPAVATRLIGQITTKLLALDARSATERDDWATNLRTWFTQWRDAALHTANTAPSEALVSDVLHRVEAHDVGWFRSTAAVHAVVDSAVREAVAARRGQTTSRWTQWAREAAQALESTMPLAPVSSHQHRWELEASLEEAVAQAVADLRHDASACVRQGVTQAIDALKQASRSAV